MKNIIILGAGESGIGCALLAQSRGYNVFVSESNNIQESIRLQSVSYTHLTLPTNREV